MTREEREEEIADAADRVRTLVENFASDVAVERKIDFLEAVKLAMAGVRRVAREGFQDPS